jgi:Tfp pilus assembly protein PilF
LSFALVIALAFLTNRSDRFCEEDTDFAPEMYLALATEADQGGRSDDAVALCQKASYHDPNSQRAHAQLAEIFLDSNEFDLAIEQYNEAIRVEERHWLFHRRGIAYRERQER